MILIKYFYSIINKYIIFNIKKTILKIIYNINDYYNFILKNQYKLSLILFDYEVNKY